MTKCFLGNKIYLDNANIMLYYGLVCTKCVAILGVRDKEMKKRSFKLISITIVMVIFCTIIFASCGEKPPANNNYTIQYTDDSGTHQIAVTTGMPYSINAIPYREGYVFTGLFDAEVGGTKYVSSDGASIAPFTDGKNIVLFPQFAAKEYTIVLDYQGAAVTGSRELIVSYNSKLPELPKSLSSPHKEFVGWFTDINCEGTQIADKYGLIPVVSVLNEENFDLSGEYVYLYAGFEAEKFTVTCCFLEGMDTEDVQIEYGTPADKIVPKTRVNDLAPLTWSKTKGGEIWNGKVERDMVLYAVEYAPIIEFDSNGGKAVKPIVARKGSNIYLPTPTKDLAEFAYWEDMRGNKYTSNTMPSTSISLKAVYNAKLVFDENGGSNVKDISGEVGSALTLPTPTKEGFIFAGWYTQDKMKYESTSMPLMGIKLKAGWYETLKANKVFLKDGEESSLIYDKSPKFYTKYVIYFNEEIPGMDWSSSTNVKLTFHANIKHDVDSPSVSTSTYATKEHFYFYSQKNASDAYLLDKCVVDHGNGQTKESYTEVTFDTQLNIKNGQIYIALCADKYGQYHYSYVGWRMTNFWCDIEYPDTNNLYL